MDKKYLTVSALNKYLKYKFDSDKNLLNVLLKGEIANCKLHSSGHCYFSIKDADSQISAVLFNAKSSCNFELKNGLSVLIEGNVSIYEASGNYQIYVSKISVDGIGDLYLKFEENKKILYNLGYFDERRKRSIPKYPKQIGVIASKTGAVIKDICNTVNRRYKATKIVLFPANVQGELAKEDIINKISEANKYPLDVLIIARGGGSFLDLWVFNELDLCMAVANSKIPIISAVGHETDYTLIDYVSDKRAITPTDAANIATPLITDIKANLDNLLNLAFNNLLAILNEKKNRLDNLNGSLKYLSPMENILNAQNNLNNKINTLKNNLNNIIVQKENELNNIKTRFDLIDLKAIHDNLYDDLDSITNRIDLSMKELINSLDQKYQIEISKLKNLNPLRLMEKGYAIVNLNDKLVKSKNDVKIGDDLNIKLSDGQLVAKVTEVK